jgi:hypothetical protein
METYGLGHQPKDFIDLMAKNSLILMKMMDFVLTKYGTLLKITMEICGLAAEKEICGNMMERS